MKTISKEAVIGYPAGIIAGVTYGLNPLFGMPLMRNGASVESILFFRYGIAVVILGALLLASRQRFSISLRQAAILLVLGLLYTTSSLLLFKAYRFIPSGLATTIIFLYPVLVALIMVTLHVVPSWPVWLAIGATFAGVGLMTQSGPTQTIDPIGILLSVGSALAYAVFIVIINRNRTIRPIPNTLLTFYALAVGAVVFLGKALSSGEALLAGISAGEDWLNLVGLAILPTIASTSTLAVATRNIGATKASVLGVFEPITAILVGTLVFGEALTSHILVGMGVALSAVTFMIVATKR